MPGWLPIFLHNHAYLLFKNVLMSVLLTSGASWPARYLAIVGPVVTVTIISTNTSKDR
jgi:hypothetical protein